MNPVIVMDKADRKVKINTEIDLSNRNELTLFRGKMINCPVIRVPIDLPVYRMRNGRTQVEQSAYIQDNNLAVDYFLNGEENTSVQRAQHKLLLKLSQDNKGNIYNELAHVRSQRFTLLLSCDGVIVNGNRRLSAMRDMYLRDPSAYSEFSHIDSVVLPPEATESDIEMIETELQLAPETKLEYGWIERRLKLRHQLEHIGIPREIIKKLYRFKREEDINVELQQLTLAEEYLETYLNKLGAYREVSKNEQLFKDLQKALNGKTGEEVEIRRLLGFLLAKESRNLGDRAYGYRDIFGSKFDDVVERFAKEEGIELNQNNPDQTSQTEDEDDPLSGLVIHETSKFYEVKEVFKDTSKSNETVEKIARILESVKHENREENLRQLALKNSQEALRLLNDIDLSSSDSSTHDQINGQLKAIIDTASSLLVGLRSNTDSED